MSHFEEALYELMNKGKVENKKIRKGLDSFFQVADQSNVGSNSKQETAPSKSLKVQEKNISADISMETNTTKDINCSGFIQKRWIYSTIGCYQRVLYKWSVSTQILNGEVEKSSY